MNYLALLLQEGPSPDQIQHMMLTILPIIFIFGIVGIFIILIPFWFICKKAGFSPWLSLLNIVPFGNLILIYVLAFAQWKVMPVPQVGWAPPQPYPPQPPQA
jgi:hypothetical protein